MLVCFKIVTNKNAKEAEKIIQREIIKLEQLCRKWHVALDPAKSKLILFSKCPRHKEQLPSSPSIRVFSEQVNGVSEAEFLGAAFDSRLTWEPQKRKIVAKAYQRLNLLRSISAQANNPKSDMLKTLYTSTIVFVFEYPSISIGTAADTHLQKLQLVQNQAMRVILNTPGFISINDLHDSTGLRPVKEHILRSTESRIASLEKMSPIMSTTINEYMEVRHIAENASILDVTRNH